MTNHIKWMNLLCTKLIIRDTPGRSERNCLVWLHRCRIWFSWSSFDQTTFSVYWYSALLQLIFLYINTGTVLCVCVCVSVCLSHTRSRERKVVAPRFLHWHEKLCLATCTNRFSSWYDAPLERKRLWKFFRGYVLTAVYPCKNFQLQWARAILPTKF